MHQSSGEMWIATNIARALVDKHIYGYPFYCIGNDPNRYLDFDDFEISKVIYTWITFPDNCMHLKFQYHVLTGSYIIMMLIFEISMQALQLQWIEIPISPTNLLRPFFTVIVMNLGLDSTKLL